MASVVVFIAVSVLAFIALSIGACTLYLISFHVHCRRCSRSFVSPGEKLLLCARCLEEELRIPQRKSNQRPD